jgi:ketosteroid isomerase-like protein
MSRESVEILRRGYEAFNRGGLEAILPFLDKEIEWRTREEGVEGNYQGHEGVRKFFADVIDEMLEGIQLEPEEFIDAGDEVVVLVHARGRGRASGAEVEERVAHVWRMREGRAIRLQAYSSKQKALQALRTAPDGSKSGPR